MRVPTREGLNATQWKKIKLQMLNTGEFNPNVWSLLDSYQKFWVNETKKSYRDLGSQ